METIKRCDWALGSQLEQEYHDRQWGKPCHDERMLFEMLILEGQQAGLSWSIILKKRSAMRKAFDNFDPAILRNYDDKKLASFLENPELIRNRLKLKALVSNAEAYYKIVDDYGSLDAFLWSYVDNEPIMNHWQDIHEAPATSEISDRLSKDLKKYGFKFVGSTIIYAYMQAIGMVNDHIDSCSFKV